MSNSIKDQLTAAIGARKDSLKALRARIIDLLEDVPVGVKLTDNPDRMDAGRIGKIARIFDINSTLATEWGLIDADGYLVCAAKPTEDSSYVLGSKREWEDRLGDVPKLFWASGKRTRDIAARLPEAIARYIAECEAEAAANESTAVEVAEVAK